MRHCSALTDRASAPLAPCFFAFSPLQRDVDVFNALDLMDNDPGMLKDLKFGPGDGHLQYYLFNWACPEMPSKGVGLVLL